MSRKLITGFVVLIVTIFAVLIISGSGVKSDSFNVVQAAKASETDAAAKGREEYEKELQELLTERKTLLSRNVESMKKFVDSGRMDMDEYVNANIALLWAEMDLSKTQNERIEILEKIIQFRKKYEEHVAKMIAIGQSSEIGLNKAKAATLEARIELIRERLKDQSP